MVNHSTLDAQKKGISTVYQEVNLCPNLSVAENLFIGREPKTKLGTIDWKTMTAKSNRIIKSLDLDIDVTKNLEEYSLALQQMIAIARAVDMDCKVLILDEPTSSCLLYTSMRHMRTWITKREANCFPAGCCDRSERKNDCFVQVTRLIV